MEKKIKVLKDVKSFTVDRKLWRRGKQSGSCLLNNAGKMCCLGFYSKDCGLDDKTIRQLASPSDVVNLLEDGEVFTVYGKLKKSQLQLRWETKLARSGAMEHVPTQTTFKIMDTNDNPELTEEEREAELIQLFKKVGITIKFKN